MKWLCHRAKEQDGYVGRKGALFQWGRVAYTLIFGSGSSSASSSNLRMVLLQSLQKFLTFSFGMPKGNMWLWNTLFSYICAPLHYVYDRSSHKDFSDISHQSFPFAYTTSQAQGSVATQIMLQFKFAEIQLSYTFIFHHVKTLRGDFFSPVISLVFFQSFSFTVVLCKPWPGGQHNIKPLLNVIFAAVCLLLL